MCMLFWLLFVCGAEYSSKQFSLLFAELVSAVNFNDNSIKIGADVSQLKVRQKREQKVDWAILATNRKPMYLFEICMSDKTWLWFTVKMENETKVKTKNKAFSWPTQLSRWYTKLTTHISNSEPASLFYMYKMTMWVNINSYMKMSSNNKRKLERHAEPSFNWFPPWVLPVSWWRSYRVSS